MKFDWKSEILLITGATSGLGRALAIQAGELQATVILLARNLERLSQVADNISLKGGKPYIFQFDLVNVYDIAGLYRKIVHKVKNTPTVLINNAGYNAAGFVQNTPIEIYERNHKVNTLAPIAFIQCVLSDMIRQGKGVIVNIMSAANYHSFPGISSYCASKFALGAIHESLKTEIAGYSIKTIYVNPGAFISNYWKNMDAGDRLKNYKHPKRKNDRDPTYVAQKILKAIEHGREEVDLSGFKDKIGYHLNYWTPKLVDRLLVSRNKKLLDNRSNL